MILAGMAVEMRDKFSEVDLNNAFDTAINEVMEIFISKETGLVLENLN